MANSNLTYKYKHYMANQCQSNLCLYGCQQLNIKYVRSLPTVPIRRGTAVPLPAIWNNSTILIPICHYPNQLAGGCTFANKGRFGFVEGYPTTALSAELFSGNRGDDNAREFLGEPHPTAAVMTWVQF